MIDKKSLFANLNEGVIDERYDAFKRNLDNNLPQIKKYGGLRRILPEFDGKSVVIVGAGPSLEKNLPLLKKFQYRDEIVIIAADMSLQSLVSHGVEPRFVISCETNPVDFFGKVNTSGMHLLAFSCMSSINLRKWLGDVSFYNWMIDEEQYGPLWDRAGVELGFVATGSIVTTQAVSLALGCNIKSLVLAGNDLAFCDRYYVKESRSYINSLRRSNRFLTLEAADINTSRSAREYELKRDEKVYYTNNQFLAAKMWLEELFSRQNIPVYDCSVPGCSGKFVNKIELKDFFSGFERKRKKKRRQV